MRHYVLAGVFLLAPTVPAAAQAGFFVRVGATASSALVNDHIVQAISVKPKVAPTVAGGVSYVIGPRYLADVEVAVSSSDYTITTGGTESTAGKLRTIAATIGLEGPLTGRLTWRTGLGILRYSPAQKEGIFLKGGTTRALLSAGLDYRVPVGPKLGAVVSGRYDFHRFTTGQLQELGFGLGQDVHRVSLSVGLNWGGR
jgi:hypothetical protein